MKSGLKDQKGTEIQQFDLLIRTYGTLVLNKETQKMDFTEKTETVQVHFGFYDDAESWRDNAHYGWYTIDPLTGNYGPTLADCYKDSIIVGHNPPEL